MSTLSADNMTLRVGQGYSSTRTTSVYQPEEFEPNPWSTGASQQFVRNRAEFATPLSASLEAIRLRGYFQPEAVIQQGAIPSLPPLNLGRLQSLFLNSDSGFLEKLSPLERKATESPNSWDEADNLRFDFLVEKDALDQLTGDEVAELAQLSRRRDRLVVRVPPEELLREEKRTEALLELQRVLAKYAPLFARKS